MLEQVPLNKIFYLLMAIIVIVGITVSSSVNVFAQQPFIPGWVKDNAKLWASNQLGDDGFVTSIQYLISQGMMSMPLDQNASVTKIPAYVKNTASWWADGNLSDNDFMQGVGYLLKTGILQLKMASTQQVTNPVPPVTNLPNSTSSQNMQNNPAVPTNTQPATKPIKILLLVSNWPVITSTHPYSFQAKVFDASQIPANQLDQTTFNQNWGTLSGVRVQGYLTSSDNKTTFYTWDGATNQFGFFVGSTVLQNEQTNQMYFVHFNATKSGMINDSKTVSFQLLNSGS